MPRLKIKSTSPTIYMPFLKPRQSQNSFATNSQNEIQTQQLSQSIQHIIATTALLESRAALYGGYLLATFADKDERWLNGIRQWTNEEKNHGEILCRITMRLGMRSPPEALIARYIEDVPYHDNSGVSVRGSIGKELVARCVVEALASTYYRALADSVREPTTHRTLMFLAQDEARHFGMFRRMLIEERQSDMRLTNVVILVTAIRRMVALGDEQISYASWLVRHALELDQTRQSNSPARQTKPQPTANKFSIRWEANIYAGKLYPLYRYQHLRYAAGMLLHIGNIRAVKMQHCLACSLWLGVRLRGFMAKVALSFS